MDSDPVAGGGTVLATIGTADDPAFGGTVVGEWQRSASLGNAAAATLADHRLVLLTGSREQVITSEASGIYDLSPDGARLFLNAVNDRAGTEPAPPTPTLSLSHTETGISITFTGTLQFAAAARAGVPAVPYIHRLRTPDFEEVS